MLAHGVHDALVVAGLTGLGSLLAPTLARPARLGASLDPHDLRVGEPEADADPTERAPG